MTTNKLSSYTQYTEDCHRQNIACLSQREWVSQGSLPLEGLRRKWFGEEQAAQIDAKSKHKGTKRPKEITVAHVGESSAGMPTRGKTKQVWEIADSLVKEGVSAARSAIIEACVTAGINPSTAATQYSAWVRARREAK